MSNANNPDNKRFLTTIELLFANAAAQGYKKPTLRAEGLLFKRAPDRGVNKDGVYVFADKGATYLGKIIRGVISVPPAVFPAVQAIAAAPEEFAIKHGRQTGECSICGRPLIEAVSVANGIGPICAEKLGIARSAPDSAPDLSLL